MADGLMYDGNYEGCDSMAADPIIEKLQGMLVLYAKNNSEVAGQLVMAYPAGVPIASSWEGAVDPILIGAISAAVKLTFQHLCESLKRGNLQRLFINSELGKSIIQNAGPKAILTTIMTNDADVLGIAFTMSDLALQIEKLLTKWQMK